MQVLAKFLEFHGIPYLSIKYMLEKYSEGINGEPWDISSLSKNRYISWKWVEDNLEKSWKCHELLCNPSLPWDFVLSHRGGVNGQPWNELGLSIHPNNPNSSRNNVVEFRVYYNMDIYTMNPNLSWKYVLEHPEGFNGQPWSVDGLSENPNISWKYVQDHPEGFNGRPWNMHRLSRNTGLSLEFLEQHLEGVSGKPWDMDGLSENPNITWDFAMKYPEGIFQDGLKDGRSWNKDKLSKNLYRSSSIWKYVEKYPEGLNGIPWDMNMLSNNQYLPWEFVIKYPEGLNGKSWNSRDGLSMNESNNIIQIFMKLPLAQKEFKQELKFKANEIKYIPGNSEYIKCKQEFNGIIQKA